jgi:hypothetical protein
MKSLLIKSTFPYVLSRACLGKRIVFSLKMAHRKGVFRTDETLLVDRKHSLMHK